MKTTTLIALALFGASTVPAFAQSVEAMKCSTFTAMDSQGRMSTIDSLRSMMGGMASADTMAGDKMAGDKMAGDKMAGEKMAGEKMGGEKMGISMSTDELTKQVAAYCQDHPDMTVRDGL